MNSQVSNVTIRKAVVEDAAEIANVHTNSWREAYQVLLPQAYLDERPLFFKNRYQLWTNVLTEGTHVVFVAECEENGVVGFVSGESGRDAGRENDAEIWTLYVLAKYHGQAVGYGLLKAFLNESRAHGFTKSYAWVLKGGPAMSFYERTGGMLTGETKDMDIAGKSCTELCYEWRDLNI